MTRRAILHIGTEKTGTTSVQHFLSHSRKSLAASGFHYSKAAGSPNHVRLFSYALGDPKLAFGAKTDADHARLRRRLRDDLGKEVAANPGKTFLFSNEHCHSRLFEAEDIARLRDLFAEFFDEVRIVVYLRRQDRVAVSLYSTLLKAGVSARDVLVSKPIPGLPAGAPGQQLYYDYRALLDRWASGFGLDALIVRRFDPQTLLGGSIVRDFCDAVGLPAPAHEPDRANESLRPEFQEFLRLINRFLKVENGATRMAIMQVVGDLGKGKGRLPTRAAAMAFQLRFAEGNEAVRRTHFANAPSLFDNDFDAYPETETIVAPDIDTISRISAEVLRAMALDVQRARAELAAIKADRLAGTDVPGTGMPTGDGTPAGPANRELAVEQRRRLRRERRAQG